MKITIFLIILFCLRASANIDAQTISLSEKNVSIEKVITKIKRQSGYVFWYESKLLKNVPAISINLQNATIQQALDMLFKDQALVYTIVDNTVVIDEKSKSSNQLPVFQNITGKVTDDKGVPLPGVNVTVKGAQKGTITDINGLYRLPVERGETIVFSFVGFKKQEVVVKEQKEINITAAAA